MYTPAWMVHSSLLWFVVVKYVAARYAQKTLRFCQLVDVLVHFLLSWVPRYVTVTFTINPSICPSCLPIHV